MSGLMSSAKMPKIAPPTALPDEEVASAAKRRTVAEETKKSGAGSNQLTAGGRETLGG